MQIIAMLNIMIPIKMPALSSEIGVTIVISVSSNMNAMKINYDLLRSTIIFNNLNITVHNDDNNNNMKCDFDCSNNHVIMNSMIGIIMEQK